MRKLNLHEMYELGERLGRLSELRNDSKKQEVAFSLWWARFSLRQILNEPSPLLDAAKRAARGLIAAISEVIAEEASEAFKAEKGETLGYGAYDISRKFREFDSVMSNEMPGIPAFIVSKKGIYSTDDLISRAIEYFPLSIQADIPHQAKLDICEAGKCLAYEVPTACSFHLWRAVEETMCAYFQALTNKPVAEVVNNRNWGTIIKSLKEHGADESVTSFLDHIRESYRNPQLHPEVMVSLDEALSLFGAAASCINQQVMAIQNLRKNPSRSLIPEVAPLAKVAFGSGDL